MMPAKVAVTAAIPNPVPIIHLIVAELRQPANQPGVGAHPALARHARAGRARIGARNRPELYPTMKPLLSPGTGGRLLDEERSGR